MNVMHLMNPVITLADFITLCNLVSINQKVHQATMDGISIATTWTDVGSEDSKKNVIEWEKIPYKARGISSDSEWREKLLVCFTFIVMNSDSCTIILSKIRVSHNLGKSVKSASYFLSPVIEYHLMFR